MTKNEYLEALQQGIYNVRFKKADGSIRDMKATLLSEHLPEWENHRGERVTSYVHGDAVVHQTGTVRATRDTSNEVVNVWDVDAKGWRSFRTDSVLEFIQD